MTSLEKKLAVSLAMLLAIVIFIPVYGLRESARQQAAADRIKSEAQRRGAELYVADCAVCHGKAGEGGVAAPLRQTKLDEAALSKVISRGILSKPVAMPAWSEEEGGPLKKHQIQDVVTFILNWDDALLKPGEAVQAPAPTPTPTSGQTSTLPPGDAVKGKQVYTTLGCAVCHGEDGRGGIGAALRGQQPSAITRVVRGGTPRGMPGFPVDRLSDADLNNIIAFLASLK